MPRPVRRKGELALRKLYSKLTGCAQAMQAVATFSEVPWIMPLLTSLPAGKDQEVRVSSHFLRGRL